MVADQAIIGLTKLLFVQLLGGFDFSDQDFTRLTQLAQTDNICPFHRLAHIGVESLGKYQCCFEPED